MTLHFVDPVVFLLLALALALPIADYFSLHKRKVLILIGSGASELGLANSRLAR